MAPAMMVTAGLFFALGFGGVAGDGEAQVVTDFMPDEPFYLDELHFHCAYAPVKSEAECMGPENGHCRKGTKCYIKDNAKTKQIYASCCCSQTDTPIDMIERNSSHWSCYAEYVTETRGKTPFCDIQCCRRPGVSRSCYGNKPICCNAEVESCGVTLQGEACCAAYRKDVHATCCHTLGTTCWYRPTSWLTVPFIQGKACCLEHLPGATCVSEQSCHQGSGLVVAESAAGVVAMAWLQASFYLNGGGARLSCGRRWSWYGKMLAPALVLLVALPVLVNFQYVWNKVSPSEALRVCAWWAIWCFVAMQGAVCAMVNFIRLWHRCHYQPRVTSVDHFQRGRENVRLAVFVNIEDYVNRGIWSRVYDRSFQKLVDEVKEHGWQVFQWFDLRKKQVDAMLEQIEPYLRGAHQPTVWLHISCHSQMVFGCPQFLPADAGRWGDGVSIFRMVRRLSSIPGCREARIHVTLNGCMDIPGGLERWVWSFKYGWRQDDFRLSSSLLMRYEAQAWILFACHPGRRVRGDEATGDIFTRKILRILKNRLGGCDFRFERHYEELIDQLKIREDDVRLHPYLITTGNTSHLCGVDESQQAEEEIPRRQSQEEPEAESSAEPPDA